MQSALNQHLLCVDILLCGLFIIWFLPAENKHLTGGYNQENWDSATQFEEKANDTDMHGQ